MGAVKINRSWFSLGLYIILICLIWQSFSRIAIIFRFVG